MPIAKTEICYRCKKNKKAITRTGKKLGVCKECNAEMTRINKKKKKAKKEAEKKENDIKTGKEVEMRNFFKGNEKEEEMQREQEFEEIQEEERQPRQEQSREVRRPLPPLPKQQSKPQVEYIEREVSLSLINAKLNHLIETVEKIIDGLDVLTQKN